MAQLKIFSVVAGVVILYTVAGGRGFKVLKIAYPSLYLTDTLTHSLTHTITHTLTHTLTRKNTENAKNNIVILEWRGAPTPTH